MPDGSLPPTAPPLPALQPRTIPGDDALADRQALQRTLPRGRRGADPSGPPDPAPSSATAPGGAGPGARTAAQADAARRSFYQKFFTLEEWQLIVEFYVDPTPEDELWLQRVVNCRLLEAMPTIEKDAASGPAAKGPASGDAAQDPGGGAPASVPGSGATASAPTNDAPAPANSSAAQEPANDATASDPASSHAGKEHASGEAAQDPANDATAKEPDISEGAQEPASGAATKAPYSTAAAKEPASGEAAPAPAGPVDDLVRLAHQVGAGTIRVAALMREVRDLGNGTWETPAQAAQAAALSEGPARFWEDPP